MASANTAALLKRIYGELANPLAPSDTLAGDIKFVPQNKQNGEDYRFPVRLGLEMGATYSTTHDSYALNGAVDGIYQVAALQGAEITMRAQLSYGEMTRLSDSKGDSVKAYDQGVAVKIANMIQGAELHREMNLLYGPGTNALANIGVISGIAVAAAAGVVTVNISRASFIPGFWQDARSAQLDVYNGATQRNPTTAFTVTGVDIVNCRVQLTGATAEAAAVAATDVIFFRGARTSSMVGMQAICENTGSLFGIDASSFPQWKPINYPVNGSLTFDKVAECLSVLADNGLTDGCTLYLNNRAWTDLLTDEVALRRYLGSSSSETAKPGFKKLEFITNVGLTVIKPHRYLKQSLAFAVPTQEWHRVGSTDITTTAPGNPDEYFFLQQPSNNGAEIRAYSDQAIVSEIPFHTAILSGISSSADSLPA